MPRFRSLEKPPRPQSNRVLAAELNILLRTTTYPTETERTAAIHRCLDRIEPENYDVLLAVAPGVVRERLEQFGYKPAVTSPRLAQLRRRLGWEKGRGIETEEQRKVAVRGLKRGKR